MPYIAYIASGVILALAETNSKNSTTSKSYIDKEVFFGDNELLFSAICLRAHVRIDLYFSTLTKRKMLFDRLDGRYWFEIRKNRTSLDKKVDGLFQTVYKIFVNDVEHFYNEVEVGFDEDETSKMLENKHIEIKELPVTLRSETERLFALKNNLKSFVPTGLLLAILFDWWHEIVNLPCLGKRQSTVERVVFNPNSMRKYFTDIYLSQDYENYTCGTKGFDGEELFSNKTYFNYFLENGLKIDFESYGRKLNALRNSNFKTLQLQSTSFWETFMLAKHKDLIKGKKINEDYLRKTFCQLKNLVLALEKVNLSI